MPRTSTDLASNTLFARINATADGSNVVIPTVTGSRIVVIGFCLTATAAGVVTIQDSAAVVLASFDLAARTPVSYSGTTEAPAFQTSVTEGLIVVTQTGQDVLGFIAYRTT